MADRYQSKPGASSAVSATSPAPATSAAITVALVPSSETTRYGYGSHSDESEFTTTTAGALSGFSIPLAGGTTFTYNASAGFVYSHANLHGDTITVTNASRQRVWSGYSGPYGEVTGASPPPNTNTPATSLGWHGEQNRITDRAIVHMGARPYSPALGRFLAVDPIEGGCANDYVYVFGDPVNNDDVSGMGVLENWGDFAACVFAEYSGVTPPGTSYEIPKPPPVVIRVPGGVAGHRTVLRVGRPGRGFTEGWEINGQKLSELVATYGWFKAAQLATKNALRTGVKVGGMITNVYFGARAAYECSRRP